MRFLVPDVLPPSACFALAANVGYLNWRDDRLVPLAAILSSRLSSHCMDEPAYVRVEQRREGHAWHSDNNNRHWRNSDRAPGYTASVLLSHPDDFSGGAFRFEDGTEFKHYGDLLVFSAEQRHMVQPHHGVRKILLMFLNE
tara:strand:- start:13030 stop:13452 length:423 start_codon:yes stop_codon:yes gene_type:complete